MRRVCALLVMPALLLAAGCARSPGAPNANLSTSTTEMTTASAATVATSEAAASSAATVLEDDTGAASTSTSTTWGTGEPSSDPTFQAVLLGPGEKPVASADIAPRVFHDYPVVKDILEEELPASMAVKEGQYALGSHLVLALCVAGAAETKNGVEVYADVWAQWFWLDGWKPVQGSGGAYPARIRLTRDGDAFRFAGIDRPKDGDGYIPSINEMLPVWVRKRVDTDEARARLEQALMAAAADWARPNVPVDLFVDQIPATIRDPHDHQPPSSQYRVLAARYVDCAIPEISAPAGDSYQPQYAMASADRRLRLHFLLDGKGAVVEDTQTGNWRSVVASGLPMTFVTPTMFDPVWVGHTLFIDFSTYLDPYKPTLTHYEIDFDSMTVVRAVPMGPLSFNEPVK